MESKLDRLFKLLEGSSLATQKAAAQQIGLIVKAHPHDLYVLLERVGPKWETRIAAGLTIEAAVANVPPWSPEASEPAENQDNQRLTFSDFDIQTVISHTAPLVASGGQELEFDLTSLSVEERLAQQRKLVNEKLGLKVPFSLDFIKDEDLIDTAVSSKPPQTPVMTELEIKIQELEKKSNDPSCSVRVRSKAKRDLKELQTKQKEAKKVPMALSRPVPAKPKQVITTDTSDNNRMIIESVVDKNQFFENDTDWPFFALASSLVYNLFDPLWEARHGAAIGLREILKKHAAGAGKSKRCATEEEESIAGPNHNEALQALRNRRWLEDCLIRLLCALTLDRFGDYGSDNVVAPVRETVAQVIGVLCCHINPELVEQALGALSQACNHKEWEVRHSCFLGMKYIILVTQDNPQIPSIKIFDSQFALILNGLQDREDDVRLVAAEALLQFVPLIASSRTRVVPQLLSILWNTLLEIDEFTTSTSAVTKLLAEIYLHCDVTEFSNSPATSLTNLVPRLFPFLRHNITSVRIGVLATLAKLIQSPDEKAWITPILGDCLRLAFQMLVLDVNETVVNGSKALWNYIVETSPPDMTKSAATPFLEGWLIWLSTPVGSPTNGAQLYRPHHANFSEGDSKSTVTLCENEVMTETMHINGATALGFLVSKWQYGPEELDTMVYLLAILLRGNLATQIKIAALVCTSLKPTTKRLQEIMGMIQSRLQIESTSWYLEVLPVLQAIHDDSIVLVDSLINLQAPFQNIFHLSGHQIKATSGGITPPIAKSLVEAYPKLLSFIPSSYQAASRAGGSSKIDQLNAKKGRIEAKLDSLSEQQATLDLHARACLAEALIQHEWPVENKTTIFSPLVSNLKKCSDQALQKKSAKALALLISQCVDKDEQFNATAVHHLIDMLEIPDHQTRPRSSDGGDELVTMHQSIIPDENEEEKPSKTKRKRKTTAPENPAKKQKIEPALSEKQESPTQNRGVTVAFEALAQQFEHVLTALPSLSQYIQEHLNCPSNPSGLLQALQILEILIPCLPSSSVDKTIEFYIPTLIGLYQKNQLNIPQRKVASQCIAHACARNPTISMQIVIHSMIPLLEKQNDLHQRLAICECLGAIVEELGIDVLPWVVFLIIPILGIMSDPERSVRESMSFIFASLIKLMPLESTIPDPPGLDKALIEKKQVERKFLEQLLDNTKAESYDLPIRINATLRSYQKEGVNWLAFLNKYNLHGILCDDMGLGKTLQAICILASDNIRRKERWAVSQSPKDEPIPSLVVCPSTVVSHWEDEVKKFCGEAVKVTCYVGASRSSMRELLRPSDIIVISYEVARSDIEFFKDYVFNYIVLDEGHLIKNPKTKLTIAIKQLRGLHRIILSGTPIQNNVLELWSLFDFLMPGFLGTIQQFNAQYSKPVLASRLPKASSQIQGTARNILPFTPIEQGAIALEALHRQVLPFILRRLKEEVLHDLPPKIIQDRYCPMSPLQHYLYHNFNNQNKIDVTKTDKSHVFQALQYLRKLCSHPSLVLKPEHPEYATLREKYHPLNGLEHAPKLLQLLNECGIGNPPSETDEYIPTDAVAPHRLLIFCQQRAMLDLIEKELFKGQMKTVTYLRMDGNTPSAQRGGLVKKFNEDPGLDCFLLTTSVGGLGLNLTGADTVIFVEHDWNPMKDKQAMDRAHRIGAKRVVNVYRLITLGTLEEKIMSLQKFKIHTADSIINAENQSFASMDTSTLLELFNADTKAPVASQTPGESFDVDGVGGEAKAILAGLGELWNEQQYNDEFDVDNFVKTLKG